MTQQTDNSEKDMYCLDWPEEQAGADNHFFHWVQPGSNICLDFHGDPVQAQLVVFSDGNHLWLLGTAWTCFYDRTKVCPGFSTPQHHRVPL